MTATHTLGGDRNRHAQDLINSLCDGNDKSLGNFKRGYILTPRAARASINKLGNGWDQAGVVVQRFAEFLKEHIYDKEGYQSADSDNDAPLQTDTTTPTSMEPWYLIKSVIDIFDHNIAKL